MGRDRQSEIEQTTREKKRGGEGERWEETDRVR